MPVANDFVMTIEDDDVAPVLDSGQEESLKPLKLSKKPKKKSATSEDDSDKLNPDFTFDIEGGGTVGPVHSWDFSIAREMLKTKGIPRVSIDELIEKKRQSTKDHIKTLKNRNKKDVDRDGDLEMANAGVGSDKEIDGEQDEEFEKIDKMEFDEDDEDIAADGFGGGVEGDEDSDEEDNEGSEYGSEEEEEEEEERDGKSLSEGERISGGEDNSEDDEDKDNEEEKARKKAYFAPEEENVQIYENFQSMNLSRPILKGLSQLGFVQPTLIQAKTIPVALLGKDICGGAVTGSGKTAAFVVPILERLLYRPRQTPTIRVLILCPTRELAIQVHSVAVKLASFTDIQLSLIVGGLSLRSQETELRQRPDVIIATPGRLIDHIRNSPSFTIDSIEILVMDEADRMLEDGFADELGEIVKSCPKSRQTMLFSATMTDDVNQLIRMSLNRPVRLMVDPNNTMAARLTQEFVRIRAHRESDRPAVLLALCSTVFKKRVIVFFRSKAAAHQMKVIFGLVGLRGAELHGNLSQEQRLEALEQFRDSEVEFLLATDLASRGLDIKGIDTVINFNMPQKFSQYLHRVGRTARAGRNGRSVTLVGETDRKLLKMAIKSSPKEQVKNRIVSQNLLEKYREKFESLTEQVKEILAEEKEDRALNQAEMEVRKSQNMLNHESEIYSRPARTWFQSKRDKAKAKDAGKEQYNAQFESKEDKKRKRQAEAPKRDKYAGMSREKRRRIQLMDEEDKAFHTSSVKAAKRAKKSALPSKLNRLPSERKNTSKITSKRKDKPEGGFSMDLADASKKNVGLAKKIMMDEDRIRKKKAKTKGIKGKGIKKLGGKSKRIKAKPRRRK